MTMRKPLLVLALGLLLPAASAFGQIPFQYQAYDLGVLENGTSSETWGINGMDYVVGASSGGYYEYPGGPLKTYVSAFSRLGGSLITLGPTTQGASSTAYAMSDENGLIVGINRLNGCDRAVYWNWLPGSMTYLPGLLSGDYLSEARGVNDQGQIVGLALNNVPNQSTHAVLWEGGVVMNLGTLAPPAESAYAWSGAYDINNSGQVVGYSEVIAGSGASHAFLWENGTGMQDLGSTVGATNYYYTYARAINDAGEIVGYGGYSNNVAWYRDPAVGAMIDIGKPGASYQYADAYDINNFSMVVGEARVDSSGSAGQDGWLWTGGTPVTLDSLLDPTSAGWHITMATGINDHWCIVGRGRNPAGEWHAVLLEPLVSPMDLANPDFGSAPGGLPAGWTATGSGTAGVIQDPHDAANFCAQLITGSPVVLTQTVDTPAGPFYVMFDYEFTTTTGTLDVILDGTEIYSLDASGSLAGEFQNAMVVVDAAALKGLSGVDLSFELDGPTGSEVLLDNVSILAMTPEPATLGLLGAGVLGALFGRKRK